MDRRGRVWKGSDGTREGVYDQAERVQVGKLRRATTFLYQDGEDFFPCSHYDGNRRWQTKVGGREYYLVWQDIIDLPMVNRSLYVRGRPKLAVGRDK